MVKLCFYCVCLFVDENDAEKGDNLIFSLHPIPVRTVTNGCVFLAKIQSE